jgi:tetratricopeptide (TPR) repeat protein
MKFKIALILTMAVGFSAFGQSKWNWPEDEEMKAMAEEKNVLYNDARKAGNYEDAAKDLNWLLENTPDLNSSLYINGVKIYKELEKTAEGEQKTAYQEKVMELYDLRVKYFNSEADVLNRKAYDAYKFYKDDKSRYAWMYELFEKAYELNGNDIGSMNLVAYMDVLRRYKLTGGELSDEEILERYTKVNDIIDYKISNGEDEEKMDRTKDFVDRMLTSMVTVDCAFISNSLGPKLQENPTDLPMAKKIMSLSIAAKCTDSPIFLEAAIAVQNQEPEYGIAKVVASKLASDEKYDEAENYYNQALELAEDNVKKADIYYEMGLMYTQRGMKASARSNFYKCLDSDPSRSKAYKLIGDLYMTSYNECKRDESKVEDRAVFIAAYDMYSKAGDQKSMANAKAQFPSIEELFTENYTEGDNFKIGCWINVAVTLQRRPES